MAVELLETLKAEKLRVDHWTDKEATRDAVRLAIRDFLWSESTGLPVDQYTEDDVQARAEEVWVYYDYRFHGFSNNTATDTERSVL